MHTHGQLACEVCGIVFEVFYPGVGGDFIECHHTLPLGSPEGARRTREADLSLVCANCHRMLYAGGRTRTLSELKRIVAKGPEAMHPR